MTPDLIRDTLRDNLRGILLMTGAMALFALEDMFLKLSAEGVPTGEILFVTALFGLVVFGGMARREGRRLITREVLHPLILARLAGEIVGSFAYIAAIASVPLPMVAAVLQATPLAVTLGAVLFMRETVGWRRWGAIAVGFAGVMLVVRPGMAGFSPPVLWVVLTVAALALRDLASRHIPRGIATSQVSGWGVGAVAGLGLVMMGWQGWVTPDSGQWLSLLGAMVFGTAGYWAITSATRVAEASVVAPFRYSRLLFVLVLAGLFFAEVPDRMTVAGAVLIIGSGLYSFMRERQRARASAKAGAQAGLSSVIKQG
jgi:drug/metabolite transporter (DMT)-like permease